ncbi:helix-turn-helix domain-containing protein [Lactobacillus delbrueckii]|uniref:helix-turn-helix domain-containing protein n=1 Tax=Lactobacillus delbrueckii TaxID=1584 RepID=UPI001C709BFC|nr:helix-turn-helix transcriptional regulator [Lactobacillus delbrueckii]MBW9308879.1 helix-turn-helix domain-containing protein [Lactobacillus delbrueckii]
MANRIKQLRKENGLTLKELSREVGIPASTISQYENEKRKIPGSASKTLSAFFKVPENYILGAWSEKEVLELMSSSLLDNYERIFEMAREYHGEGDEWLFFNEIDLDLFSEEDGRLYEVPGTFEETEWKNWIYTKEIRENHYMSLAFVILRCVFFKGLNENLYTAEHIKALIEEQNNLYSKTQKFEVVFYPEFKGYEEVKHFMNSFLDAENGKENFLNAFLQDNYDFEDVLTNVVIEKLMKEKASKETMSLALISIFEKVILRYEEGATRRKYQYVRSRYEVLKDDYHALSKHAYELQKENDRLKAELASKR